MTAVLPPLRLGPITVDPPVVLAPMAGVTNAPFRRLCRRYGGGLYVSEMITARALIEGNAKTARMVTFGPDEQPRSLQLYGTDPAVLGEAVRRLVGEGRVDHVDLNLGCPAPKVTRRGGGAALPVKRALLRAIVRSCVAAAAPAGVPVTMKFRMGVDDRTLTFLETGRIGEGEGVAAIALHARTAEQLYSGRGRLDRHRPPQGGGDDGAGARQRRHLGSGRRARRWSPPRGATASSSVAAAWGGRGCSPTWRRPSRARSPSPPPRLGEVATVMADHARLLVDWAGEGAALRDFRKHTGWYLTGYPCGPEVRRRLAMVETLAELDDLLAGLDPDLELVPGGQRIHRGHTNGPRPVHLPHGWLDDPDDASPLPPEADALVSGG